MQLVVVDGLKGGGGGKAVDFSCMSVGLLKPALKWYLQPEMEQHGLCDDKHKFCRPKHRWSMWWFGGYTTCIDIVNSSQYNKYDVFCMFCDAHSVIALSIGCITQGCLHLRAAS